MRRYKNFDYRNSATPLIGTIKNVALNAKPKTFSLTVPAGPVPSGSRKPWLNQIFFGSRKEKTFDHPRRAIRFLFFQ